MSRPFTIEFLFHEQPVTALVQLDPQGIDLSCRIRYINRDIDHLIPGRLLCFSLVAGVEDDSLLCNEETSELVSCTTEAIAQFLAGAA